MGLIAYQQPKAVLTSAEHSAILDKVIFTITPITPALTGNERFEQSKKEEILFPFEKTVRLPEKLRPTEGFCFVNSLGCFMLKKLTRFNQRFCLEPDEVGAVHLRNIKLQNYTITWILIC